MKHDIAGVYALHHRKTGRVYVGSGSNIQSRFDRWRSRFNVGRPSGISAAFRPLLPTRADEWDYIVIKAMDSLSSPQALIAAEKAALTALHSYAPGMALNSVIPYVANTSRLSNLYV